MSDFNKILRYILIGGVFLVPFIPFIVSTSMFFPFITGKNFAFRILTEILFALWVILALRNLDYRPRFSWIAVAIAAFVGVIAIADIFGVNPAKSIWSNYERMEGLVTLVHLLAYFLVLGSILHVERLWTWFWNTAIGASVIMGLYGVFQLTGQAVINQGGVRLDARLGNATYLAEYMLFHIFITAFLLLRWHGKDSVRYIYGAIILFQGYILYHTATRGAILGLLGGAVLTALLIVFLERHRPKVKKFGVGMLIAITLVVGGFFLIRDATFVKESQVLARFSTSLITSFKEERLVIWNMAFEGLKERPILGWGQENFNFVFNEHYKAELYDQEQWFDRVHNIVLDWLIAGGIVGLLSYLSIFLALLYSLWFVRNNNFSLLDKSVITGFIAAYSFHNLFVFDNIVSYVFFFSLLAYVHFHVSSPTNEHSFLNRELQQGLVDRLIIPLIILTLIFSVYFINGKGMRASMVLIDALSRQTTLTDNLELFRKALAYDSFGGQEIREQLVQAASQIRQLEVDLTIKQQFFDLARKEMEKQIEEHTQKDARHVLFLATLLDSYGQSDEALTYYKKSKALSPEKQVIRLQIGGIYLARGEYEKALQEFRETFELDQNYMEARIQYAVSALYVNNDALAEELLTPTEGSSDVTHNDSLLRAYFTTGRMEKVLELWQKRAAESPNNPQVHLSLAAAYLQVNRRSEAIAEIENVITLDPGFKEQGEFLIGEIRAGRNP